MSRFAIPTERAELDNGLRVVISRDTTVPVVAVNLWYNVGSRNERAGRTGFAHLFEHMMFQGSAHVPKGGHFDHVQRAGGSLNATTSSDRTNYFETLPSHHLDLALWLESDRMGWMVEAMTQEKLDNQRDVVKNEKLQRHDNQPYGDWSERLRSAVFPPGHHYHHTVIGSMEDLDAASLDDIVDFFQTYYRPNNCVLSIVGDVHPEAALDSVKRYFDSIERGGGVPPIGGRVSIPPTLDRSTRNRVEADVPLPRVFIGLRIPSAVDERFDAVRATSRVLGAGRASRLYSRLVREQRVAKDVGAYAFPFTEECSMLLLYATGYEETEPEELEVALVKELEDLKTVNNEEVRRAHALFEVDFIEGLERRDHRANLLSKYTALFDDPTRINTRLTEFTATTAADIHAFANEYVVPENRAIVTYVPRNTRDA